MKKQSRAEANYGNYEKQVILDCVDVYPRKSTAFREAARQLPGRSKNGISNFYYRFLKKKSKEEKEEIMKAVVAPEESNSLKMVKELVKHLDEVDKKKLTIYLVEGM